MIFYYLDASAWVKRYYLETGTSWLQALFDAAPTVACASLGLVEVMATLARKHKAEEIDSVRTESPGVGRGLGKLCPNSLCNRTCAQGEACNFPKRQRVMEQK